MEGELEVYLYELSVSMDLVFDQLDREVNNYVRLWAKNDISAAANMPYALYLYFEMKDTGGLLTSGGILEQPDWLWQLTKKAGIMYEAYLEEVKEELEFERLAEDARLVAINEGIQKKLGST